MGKFHTKDYTIFFFPVPASVAREFNSNGGGGGSTPGHPLRDANVESSVHCDIITHLEEHCFHCWKLNSIQDRTLWKPEQFNLGSRQQWNMEAAKPPQWGPLR